MTSSESLALAIPTIWNDLPGLLSDNWPRFERELWILLGKLEAAEPGAADSILELFAAHPVACMRLDEALAEPVRTRSKSVVTPAGTSRMKRHVIIPVLYGTDRKPHGDGYANEPGDGELSLGVAHVSVPEDHRMGEFERPPWWKLGFGWDPDKHLQLLSVHRFDREEFVVSARGSLAQASRNEALIFIHGFNVDFADAARRAAQLAYDLRFEGQAMLYSWSSKGRRSNKWYQADADKIIWTRPRLRAFLEMVLTELGVEAVHVIAHSMGNRALAEVLKDLEPAALPDDAARLRQIVFAAPDVNARTFQDLATEFHGKAERCTLYASSEDLALKYSKQINKAVRAGDSGGFLTLQEGLDTIDVTAIDTSFVGHSFFGDNTSVLSDLDLLIRHGHAPQDRPRLDSRGSPDRPYWVFRA